MAKLQELLSRKEALEREIEQVRKQERADAIAQVHALMAEHGLTLADLSAKAGAKTASGGGAKVAPKFRDKASGQTWSGRGLQPTWLKAALAAGAKLDDFRL